MEHQPFILWWETAYRAAFETLVLVRKNGTRYDRQAESNLSIRHGMAGNMPQPCFLIVLIRSNAPEKTVQGDRKSDRLSAHGNRDNLHGFADPQMRKGRCIECRWRDTASRQACPEGDRLPQANRMSHACQAAAPRRTPQCSCRYNCCSALTGFPSRQQPSSHPFPTVRRHNYHWRQTASGSRPRRNIARARKGLDRRAGCRAADIERPAQINRDATGIRNAAVPSQGKGSSFTSIATTSAPPLLLSSSELMDLSASHMLVPVLSRVEKPSTTP